MRSHEVEKRRRVESAKLELMEQNKAQTISFRIRYSRDKGSRGPHVYLSFKYQSKTSSLNEKKIVRVDSR